MEPSPVFLVRKDYFTACRHRLQHDRGSAALSEQLDEIARYIRINTLATIYHAKHGWLGASLSCTDLLAALYFQVMDPEQDLLILSKGHAAAAQYAALAGLGFFPENDLLNYKMPTGPQAHTDLNTPGIPTNTGSLGQSLSKAFGLGWKGERRIFVILGDGELQEGQNFEAFMTLVKHNCTHVVPIIDRNFIQSDSTIEDIKPIANLHKVLEGFGFDVRHLENGNDMQNVLRAFAGLTGAEKPTVILADTAKGAGISFMSTKCCERRNYQWHGGIPDPQQYRAALAELTCEIRSPELKAELGQFLDDESHFRALPETAKPTGFSTGMSFADALVKLAPERPELVVLDADLEKPCKLATFATRYPGQFLEMGIAEQDMVSTAGGLALQGLLPVVNTYGSFFRRAYEQIYVNASEHSRIIYAGHYSGLCYTTDGKTHQCTGDIAMMRAIPDMLVFYPAFPEELAGLLDWYLNSAEQKPVYIRLHRTPFLHPFDYDAAECRFTFGHGMPVRQHQESKTCILTSGPQMTAFCVAASEALGKARTSIDVHSVSTLRYLDPAYLGKLAATYENLIVIEELICNGGLFDEVCQGLAKLGKDKLPKVHHHAVDGFTFSDRTPTGLYQHFNLTPERLYELIRLDI